MSITNSSPETNSADVIVPQETEVRDFEYPEDRKLPTEELLETISEQINRLITDTDTGLETKTKNAFFAPKKPSISIFEYLKRIHKFTECSDVCFLLALIYIDRIQEIKKEIVLNSLTTHRFLLVAVVVAMKFYEDQFYKNDYYAKVGGIPKEAFNKLEMDFLQMCDYQLHVRPDLFEMYYETISSKKQMMIEEESPNIITNNNNNNYYLTPTIITTQFSNFFNFYNFSVYENLQNNYAQEVLSE